MKRKVDELPNWKLQVDEVSAGVYKACAVHSLGATIELTGADPDLLLRQVKNAAAEMERNTRSQPPATRSHRP
jgi:hypothetical protein